MSDDFHMTVEGTPRVVVTKDDVKANPDDNQPDRLVEHDVTDLAKLRREIQYLERRLSELRKQEADLLANTARVILAYGEKPDFSTLPNDILQEIFVLCLPESSYLISFWPNEAPVLLTHVCSHWREVALGCTRLWRSLNLKIGENEADIELAKELFEVWLLRTKSSRQELHAISAPHTTPGILNGQLAFLTDQFPTMHSLTRLTLARIPASLLNNIPPNSFPLLENLVLLLPDIEGEWHSPITAFENSSGLKKVALGGIDPALAFPVVLPTAQLSHLIIPHAMGSTFWTKYLISAPRLKSFEMVVGVKDVDPTPLSSAPYARKLLPSLEQMTLWSWQYSDGKIDYPAVFRRFEFPQLRSLRFVASHFQPGIWQQENLNKLKSLQHLETLSLALNSTWGLSGLFPFTPHVRTLHVEIWDSCIDLFHILTLKPEPHAENLLLNLTTLEFDVGAYAAGTMRVVPSDLAALVRSRMQGTTLASRLERVVFHGTAAAQLSRDAPYIHCLRPFIKDGLKIDFRLHEYERSYRPTAYWIEMDSYLEGWREAGVVYSDTFY
ncbi:hypothetical protein FA15DRAFT_673634 [Coprinopsis marcescibilis]|uniref:Uncharacterized protein n=1 Tax=Coprinopsis marcescibilis TaxID=230819 RepID=A0A5C3KK59_COPMA|nr:hypothetical protein FA15DRAFT_673634 [Coprinopsis marcescibilis]